MRKLGFRDLVKSILDTLAIFNSAVKCYDLLTVIVSGLSSNLHKGSRLFSDHVASLSHLSHPVTPGYTQFLI